MKTLYHISDLHFGKDRPELIEPLLAALEGADIVAISGDLTQRARTHQFMEAQRFIQQIKAPTLVVPGNHDIPLHNIARRFINPYGRYRRYINADLCPEVLTPEMSVIGLNTVAPWHWQKGSIPRASLRKLTKRLPDLPGLRVLVAHHPFEQDSTSHKSKMRGARHAMNRLADAGLDMVLTGHLHLWRSEPFVSEKSGRNVLQLHVGTGLSTRLRSEKNDFAVIRCEGDQVEIQRMVESDGRFRPAMTQLFRRSVQGWRKS